MRAFGFGCLLVWMASILSAQTQQLPQDHPQVGAPDSRATASDLTERLRPSSASRVSIPMPRKNLIDEFIFGKMEKDGVPHAALSSDEEFFRRIHIDLTGRLPQDDQLRAFLASSDPGKRDKLIDQLTTGRPYETKWTYFFNDIYKPAPGRIGNAAKNVFYLWVRDNIHLDRPYNEMVYEMLTSNATSNWYIGPASYVARWVITAVACEDEVHEDTSDELAIHAAKDFLGVDISCASCHDGARHLEKINLYLSQRKREEIWKMAAFFGKTNVLRRTEVSTAQDEYSIDDNGPGYDPSARSVIRVPRRGKPGLLEPAYMFTGERPDPAKHPRPEFARMLTSDPQFARATVNLLWAEMFGVGIVEPVFAFDMARLDPKNPPPAPWGLQPTHPELLEALAQYFRDNNYSIRSVVKLIAKSNAYQLSSQFPGEWKVELRPVLRAQVRAPAESRGSLRFAGRRHESLHRGSDSRHRRQSAILGGGVFPGRVHQGRERSDSQGDPLLPRIVRSDEPAILRAQQRRCDHPGRAAHEQPARPSSDQGGGGELRGGTAQAGNCG